MPLNMRHLWHNRPQCGSTRELNRILMKRRGRAKECINYTIASSRPSHNRRRSTSHVPTYSQYPLIEELWDTSTGRCAHSQQLAHLWIIIIPIIMEQQNTGNWILVWGADRVTIYRLSGLRSRIDSADVSSRHNIGEHTDRDDSSHNSMNNEFIPD